MARIFGILIAVLFLSVGHTASAEYSSELLKRAKDGDAEAQFALGDAYLSGNGVDQSDAEGLKWYRLAAEQGNVDAQGVICSIGLFLDDEEARTEIFNRCESWEKQRHAESIEENKKYGFFFVGVFCVVFAIESFWIAVIFTNFLVPFLQSGILQIVLWVVIMGLAFALIYYFTIDELRHLLRK